MFKQMAGIRGCRGFFFGMALAFTTACPVVMADDTEVFYGQGASLDDNNPNLLFVLDMSSSMKSKDGYATSRMERMKEAMRAIIDQSSSFNVGIMGFSGWEKGSSVRYPIGYLEGSSDDNCPETGCPDEVIVSRVKLSSDDAVEDGSDGSVVLDGADLQMAEAESTSTSTSIPAGATLITELIAATEVTTETTRRADNVVVNGTNAVADSWFTFGPEADYTSQITGYRFNSVPLPDNAVVTEAYLTFTYADGTLQTGNVSAYIAAEAMTSPVTYPDALAIPEPDPNPYLEDRGTTSEVATWIDIPAGVAGSSVDSPDLKLVLQEVLSLPGWVTGNDLSFVVSPFSDFTPDAGNNRQFKGLGAAVVDHPELSFTYYIDTASTSTGTTTISASQSAFEYIDTDGKLQSTISGSEINLFNFNPGDPGELSLLFENTGIPDGANITNAYLMLTDLGGTGSFRANITAEKSAEPAPYGSISVASRDYVTTFVEVELPDMAGSVVSPDLTAVLEELRAAVSWTSSSSIALHVSKGADYLSDGSMLRKIGVPGGAAAPILIIDWEIPATTTGPTVVSQQIGLRFQNIHVPPEAQIESAFLEFYSNAADVGPTSLTIRGELASNAETFTATTGNIGLRPTTSAGVNWVADPWTTVNTKFSSVDIKSVIQEQVNQADWCGGNAVAMIISGTGIRDAVAFDQSPSMAPTLRVTYKPDTVPAGAYCSNRSSVASISAGGDDATENLASGSVTLTGNSLNLVSAAGASGEIALRFRDVPVAQGTSIVSAVLELTSSIDMAATASAEITADDDGDSPSLVANDNNITNRSVGTTTVAWNNIPQLTTDTNAFSPDISDVVSEVIGRSDWVKGNALTIHLKDVASSSATSFHSFEGNEALSPKLILYYQDERSQAGTLFKENLKREIDELVALSGTPIVGAQLEAAYYYLGDAVQFGKTRGWQNSIDRNNRVSHPFSYTGGTLNRPENCTEADLNASDCRWETITGNPQYISPIANQCQQNHIILLSDGEPSSNGSEADVRALTGDLSCTISDGDSNDQACGRELAYWLANTDHSSTLPGIQSITTHTIGFNLSSPDFLEDLADLGGGEFYSANSASDLLTAFKTIFNSVSKRDSSFVAPSAAVNQFNRLKNRDDLYFSLFKPEATARWDGNIKRYKLQGSSTGPATIVDKYGDLVIEEGTGEFIADTTSFWTTGADGGVVTKGGAAARFEGSTARLIVTYTGTDDNLTDISNRVSTANTELAVADFQLPPAQAADTAYVDDLVNWVAGYDVNDVDGDGNTTENRTQMGDPLHAQPLLINYTATGTTPDSVIFAATNEGYLHAIDYANGKEHFAFVPKDLLPNMRHYFENSVVDNRVYGLDGPITAWIKDTNNDGVVDAALGDKAYLYFGMRRGGRIYYALDVTDYNSPKWLWSIKGGEGDFADLGQSWSALQKTKIRDGSEVRDVLVFAGGYDGNNHDASGTDVAGLDSTGLRKDDFLGSEIYIVDAETGDLIWKPTASDPYFNKMTYSISSDIRVIDINSDGLADQLYVGDLGGQIWRLDINNGTDTTDSVSSRISGGVVADFGGAAGEANRRRFYYPPDVAVVAVDGVQKLAVSTGSGWRAHPLDLTVQDRFYSFRMDAVFGPPLDSSGNIDYPTVTESTSGMVDVTSTLSSDPASNIGWYFDLGTANGEKVLASSVTFDNKIVFTSYIPASAADSCAAAIGSGRVYAVDVLNGDPVFDLDDDSTSTPETLTLTDRYDDLERSGIPPPPVIVFPEIGNPALLLGPEVRDDITIENPKRRTFWVEHIDSD